MDERYVNYKGRFKKKAPQRADHLKKHQFKKGECGRYRGLQPRPPWKPGESGNPKGRPKGSISIVERLKAYLRRHPEDVDKIAKELVELGKVGNPTQLNAIKEIMDRVDGKVTERHKLEGEMPIKLLFVPAQQVLDAPESPQLLGDGQGD